MLCTTCAISLVVQLISPLTAAQACCSAPVPTLSSAVYTCGHAVVGPPQGGSATASLLTPGPWHNTLTCNPASHAFCLEVVPCMLKCFIPHMLLSAGHSGPNDPPPSLQVMTFSQSSLQLVTQEEYLKNKRRPAKGQPTEGAMQ